MDISHNGTVSTPGNCRGPVPRHAHFTSVTALMRACVGLCAFSRAASSNPTSLEVQNWSFLIESVRATPCSQPPHLAPNGEVPCTVTSRVLSCRHGLFFLTQHSPLEGRPGYCTDGRCSQAVAKETKELLKLGKYSLFATYPVLWELSFALRV